MMLDMQNLVSDAQTIAAAAGTIVSTNAIDLWGAASAPNIPGPAGVSGANQAVIKDVGRGEEAELLVQLVETVTSGGAATVQFQLVTADDAALTTNPIVLQETAAIALATLVAGYQARLSTPVGVTKRYLGCKYVIGTATTTAGKVTAGVLLDKQQTFVG